MDGSDVVRSLAALAHELRLQVFRALVVASPQGMKPGVMAEGLGIAPSVLSFHLKELMNAGLVTHERQGRNLVYRASFDHMEALLSYMAGNCCQGETGLEQVAASDRSAAESKDKALSQ